MKTEEPRIVDLRCERDDARAMQYHLQREGLRVYAAYWKQHADQLTVQLSVLEAQREEEVA